jgi:predicted ATPase/DNA-binding winged helix-turn-helix (wHTH) protein
VERAFSFGAFQLFPAQRTLLEDDKPVRLGSRALDLLVELVTHAGQIIGKEELISRVWLGVFVDEGSLRVHISALRLALGDDRAPHRYIVNVPNRGYCFIGQVASSAAPTVVGAPPSEYRYNLPVALTRMIGRSGIVASLIADLPRRRLITVVGPGGIGKTRVALAVAEAVAPSYPDGARFIDFSPVGDAQLVPGVVASALGLSAMPSDPTANIIAFLRDNHLLLVLDSCEHVLGEAAALAERILQHAPDAHLLVTSREPLKVQGERLRRLPALAAPPFSSEISAEIALTFPAVELFVERASAILDSFSLNDTDAPVVAGICQKLDGIPLAIELVAGRVEALGIPGLAKMLGEGFELFAKGGGATARHRTMNDTLEWSYKWLSEAERAMLYRLGIFVGYFGIDAVTAIMADIETRAPAVAERLASLVSKSLVTADAVGADIAYRLLDTTRAYALEKLAKSGELNATAGRHAQHYRAMMERAEDDWRSLTTSAWLEKYGRNIGDIRGALKWAYSQEGNPKIGVELTIVALPLWYQSGLMVEYQELARRALATEMAEPYQEMKLLDALGQTTLYDRLPENDRIFTRALFLAQELADQEYQLRALGGLYSYYTYRGDFNKAHASAERAHAVAIASGNDGYALSADALLGIGFRYLGDCSKARQHLDRVVQRPLDGGQSVVVGYRFVAEGELSNVLWLQGFPDQAIRNLEMASDRVRMTGSKYLPCLTLANVTCPLALFMGDLAVAESSVQLLSELSVGKGFTHWAFQARCLQGALLTARGDASGLVLIRAGLDQLREAGFGYYMLISLCFLAEGLRCFGVVAEARATIDEALVQSDRSRGHWITPELLRIKGEIVRRDSAAADSAEDYFLRSLDWARRQDALSWELRAAMSLARLWRDNGNDAQALDLLSAVYGRFTEGFGTADLTEAKSLLDQLRTNMS